MAQFLPTRQLLQHQKKAQASRRQTTAHFNSQKYCELKTASKMAQFFNANFN
jgi:hypothetical protein